MRHSHSPTGHPNQDGRGEIYPILSLVAKPLTEVPLAKPTQKPVGRKSRRCILQEKDEEWL